MNPFSAHVLQAELNKQSIDVLICCVSFEERCTAVASIIDDTNVSSVLLFRYPEPEAQISINQTVFDERFPAKVNIAVLDADNPTTTADTMLYELSNEEFFTTDAKIVVDITTFTHEALLILFQVLVLNKNIKNENISFVYSSAAEYSLDAKEFGNKWLSKGISEIRSVLGFPGMMNPTQHNHLIILTGYEHERALHLIEDFEPNAISLGLGKECEAVKAPPNIFFEHLLSNTQKSYSHVGTFDFACHDVLETYRALEKYLSDMGDINYIIAPMNTKISTLACAMFAGNHPNVQLCYAQPAQYNFASYSKSGSVYYKVDLIDLMLANSFLDL